MPAEVLVQKLHDCLSELTQAAAAISLASGQELLDGLALQGEIMRSCRFLAVRSVNRAEVDGVFTEHSVRSTDAVAQLLRCTTPQARKLVRLADKLCPTMVGGVALPAALPATAAAAASGVIDLERAGVIDELMSSRAASRLSPEQWAFTEAKLAEWATEYTPAQLRRDGRRFIDLVDQDGAEPDLDDDAQVHELFLTRDPGDRGGWVKGRLDSTTFDAFTQALGAYTAPHTDDGKSVGERQADALTEMVTQLLDSATLPEVKAERPHLSMIIDRDDLAQSITSASLTATGCRIGPRELARLACDSQLMLLLRNSTTSKIDAYAEHRTASKAQRRALAARDRGCAFPGCDRAVHRCEAHHLAHWSHGGETVLDNLALLCPTHHKSVHGGGWTVHMHHGRPRFVPPRWLDPRQTPRQKPAPHLQC